TDKIRYTRLVVFSVLLIPNFLVFCANFLLRISNPIVFSLLSVNTAPSCLFARNLPSMISLSRFFKFVFIRVHSRLNGFWLWLCDAVPPWWVLLFFDFPLRP